MKRFFILAAALLLILSFTACSSNTTSQDPSGKTSEQGNLKDVDVAGDTMTFEGSDGQQVVVSSKWPDSEHGKSIPAFEKGRIGHGGDRSFPHDYSI